MSQTTEHATTTPAVERAAQAISDCARVGEGLEPKPLAKMPPIARDDFHEQAAAALEAVGYAELVAVASMIVSQGKAPYFGYQIPSDIVDAANAALAKASPQTE